MQRRFGSVEFQQLTGLSKAMIHRMKISGEMPGNLYEGTNKTYYLYSDFSNPYLKKRMHKAGKVLPKSLLDEILDSVMGGGEYTRKSPPPNTAAERPERVVEPVAAASEPGKPKLKLVEKPNIVRSLVETSTYFDLENLQEGLMTTVIPPVEGLDYIGRSTWNITIKTLVAQKTFKTADILSLVLYCQTADQLESYREDVTYYVDAFGKINPLLGEIKTCKATMRGLAKDLLLTPDSRKNIKVQDNAGPDANTQAWLEAVK